MKGFYWAYDLNGAKVPMIKDMYIPTGTVIEEGEIVAFTMGTGIVVADGTDFDTCHLGVALHAHPANSGTSLKVSVSPTAVYAHGCGNVITATGGSTTTFVVSGLLPATDDVMNGGYLKIIACAADATLNGKKIKITDHTGSGGTLTFATQGAAFAAGDTAYLCPGPLAITGYGWDLDSDGMNVDWDTDGGSALTLVESDPANMTAYFKFRLHYFGDYPKALD